MPTYDYECDAWDDLERELKVLPEPPDLDECAAWGDVPHELGSEGHNHRGKP